MVISCCTMTPHISHPDQFDPYKRAKRVSWIWYRNCPLAALVDTRDDDIYMRSKWWYWYRCCPPYRSGVCPLVERCEDHDDDDDNDGDNDDDNNEDYDDDDNDDDNNDDDDGYSLVERCEEHDHEVPTEQDRAVPGRNMGGMTAVNFEKSTNPRI